MEALDRPPAMGAGEVHIWQSDLDQRSPAHDRTLLSGVELQRADRLRNRRLAHRYVARHALLRQLLSAYVGVDPTDITYTEGAHGKPLLTGEPSAAGWRFNVSESDGRCLIAVSRDVEVGVDVQVMRPIVDLVAVAREVLADDELDSLFALPSDDRTTAFYSIWARKEALVKATGEGLTRSLKDVRVDVDRQRECAVAWSDIRDGFAFALATDRPPTRVRLLRQR